MAATLSLALLLSPLTAAQAFEQNDAAPTASGNTITQTQPSGLDISYVMSGGNVTGTSGGGMGTRGGVAANFITGLSLTANALQASVSFSGCAIPGRNASNLCSNRGTITVNFEHPTSNPVINVAGLGGSLSDGTRSLIYSGVLRLQGGTTPSVLNGTNLQVSDTAIQGANVRTDPSCSNVLTNSQGVPVTNGATAGCGSVRVPGTYSQLVFQMDMQATCVSTSLLSDCASLNTATGSDVFQMSITNDLDYGDAPSTYNAGNAARHNTGSLALGSATPDDDGGGRNNVASPIAVGAGASANGSAGDNASGADEDAFTTLPDVVAQGTVAYPVTVPLSGTSKAGSVAGWIDFNRNGIFEAGERAAATFAAGATSATLSFTKPSGLTPGSTYARFRTAFDAGDVANPTGPAASGEVEDYSLNIVNEVATLDFTKSAGPVQDTNNDGLNSVGDQVTYTFTATNTGNARINSLAVADPKITGVSCAATFLLPNTSTTCTGTYTLTAADVAAGNVANTATISGTTVNGTAVSATASANRSITRVTSATLAKSAGTLTDPDGNGPDVGDQIPYTFTVTNTGNQPLTGVTINDPKITGVTCPAGNVAPGGTKLCTATYTLTQADVNAGQVVNTATASVTSAAGNATTPSATATKTFTPSSTFTFDKQSSAINDLDTNGPDAGDTIVYSFVFANTGTTTLNTPSVTDNKIGAVTCPTGTVDPGSTITCTKTYVLTQADVDSGAVNNTASGVLKRPDGTNLPTSATDSTSTTVTPSNAVKLTKTAGAPALGANNRADPGDTITYSFEIENTGGSTLTNPTVTDPKVGPVTCATGTLAPGAKVTCTKTYAITQADIDAGQVFNSATASATRNGATITSAASQVTTPLTKVSTTSFDKQAASIVDANGNSRVDAGDTIQYSFITINTGNTTLESATVNDNKVGPVTCSPTTIAPGATLTCTKTYVLTQADVDSGAVNNTASITTTPRNGTAFTSAPDSTSTTITSTASMTLAKTPGDVNLRADGILNAGDTLPYTFTVTNTGAATINGITVTDPKISANPLTCSPASLAPNGTATCSGTYTLTQADIDAGKVDNSATANGTRAGGGAVSANRTATKTLAPVSSFTFDKQAGSVTDLDGNGPDVGDTITYSFVFLNTGATTLNTPAVTDNKIGAVTCPTGTVAPGATITCTKAYALTQGDVDSGSVNNIASGVLKRPDGTNLPASATDSTSTPIAPSAALKLTKTAGAPALGANNRADPGDTITYSFEIENTGASTLTNPAVSDPKVGPVTCAAGTLAPGAKITCTKTYAITQADIDAGSVPNTATATATRNGTTVTSNTSQVTTPLTKVSSTAFDKQAGSIADANGNNRVDAGDTIQYSFITINTGNTTLESATVNDAKVGPVTCSPTTIAPGATLTCTKTYTLTQADVDSGAVNNTATITTTPRNGTAFTSAPDTTSTPINSTASMTLDKVPGDVNLRADGVLNAGDTIPYTFTVTNTGAASISNITVSDPKLSATPLTCSPSNLAPGGTSSCSGTYTLTQADVDAGRVDNSATANGTRAGGGAVSANKTATKTFTPVSSFSFDKSAGAIAVGANGRADAGETITYSFTFTNTGGTTLTAPVVTDPKIGPVTCAAATLTPGQSATCTKSYALSQADINSGAVNNTATGQMSPPAGLAAPASVNDSHSVPINPANSLTLTKSASAVATGADGRADVGDTITYSFVVSNAGNQTVTDVAVSDPKIGAITCPSTTLTPGTSVTCTKSYALTQADIDAGKVDNTASARATSPGGATINATDSSVSTPLPAAPSLTIDKQAGSVTDVNANNRVDAGDTIAYGFVIQNTGNVTLDSVRVDDPKIGAVVCPSGPLAPGATRTCTPKQYTITQADVDTGAVANSATAKGTPPAGGEITSPADTTSTPTTSLASVSLTKTAGAINDVDGNGPDVGDTVTYTLTATNSGTRTLSGVQISDPKLPGLACPAVTLTAGQSTTCTGTHTLTQAEVDAGTVQNAAVVTGTATGGTTVTDSATVNRPIVASSSFSFDKQSSAIALGADNRAGAGDTITYTFVFTNTGATTLRNPTVTDTKIGAVTCPSGEVAPGAEVSCQKVYTLTQADVDSGSVNNTATGQLEPNAAGTPAPTPATRTDSTSTPVAAVNILRLTKTAGTPADTNNSGTLNAGDTITYSFLLVNSGTSTLTTLRIDDPKIGEFTCPGVLAPNATRTCTRPYVLTRADLDAGGVTNSATASAVDTKGTELDSNTSTITTDLEPAASMTFDKQAATPTDVNGNGKVDTGDTIAYRFSVQNTGNVSLNTVTITDDLLGPITCPGGALAPGATRDCGPFTYTITQADTDAGAVDNVATAEAQPARGDALTRTDSTSTNTTGESTLTVTKSAGAVNTGADGRIGAGDTVPYTINVANTGTRTIDLDSVSDPLIPTLTCARDPLGSLAAGASLLCVGSYTLTQADIDSGKVDNTATATGTDRAGNPVTASGSATRTLQPVSTFDFDKRAAAPADANNSGQLDAGDTIEFTFEFTNTGTTSLRNPSVSDPAVGPVTCAPGTVAPGDSISCTTVYTLTQTDLDAGAFNNTATGSIDSPAGRPAPTPPTRTDSTSTTLAPDNALVLTKTASEPADANNNGRVDVGEEITYSFAVQNPGNQTLRLLDINDPLIGTVTCPTTTVPAGQTVTCTKTLAVTQAMIDAGGVSNSATATATTPAGGRITSNTSTVETDTDSEPGISLDKQAAAPVDVNGNGRTDAGDTIRYTFVISNDGNTTLQNLAVNDPKLGAIACPSGDLAPGNTATCTPKVYTITQADVNAGAVANSATATGTPPGADPLTSAPDETSTPTTTATSVSLVKVAGSTVDVDGNGLDAGDTVPYTFTVSNTGTTTLTDIVVTDAKIAGGVTCSPTTLQPGRSVDCTGSHTLTQAEIDAGQVDNSARVDAVGPGGAPATDTDTVSKPLVPVSSFTFDKQSGDRIDVDGDGQASAGDQLTYTFVFTNTGGTTLDSPVVTDPKITDVSCPATPIAPAGQTSCTGTYTLTQADVDAGAINNTARGEMSAGANVPQPPAKSDSTSTAIPETNRLQVLKEAADPEDANGDGVLNAGDTIDYTFTVTNTGNQTLSNVQIEDPRIGGGVTCPDGDLAPLADAPSNSVECMRTYTLTQADLDAGEVVNTASASAESPEGTRVESGQSVVTTELEADPSIELDKQADPAAGVNDVDGNGPDEGDTIEYTFVIENTGNVTLDGLELDDPKLDAVSCPSGALAPGAVRTCGPITYTLTQADVDAGAVNNDAEISASDPTGNGVDSTDSTSNSFDTQSTLSIEKEARAISDADDNGNDVGDRVSYDFTITNTGTTTLTLVGVDDPKLGPAFACSPETLQPGAVATCSGSYMLTQADIDAGEIANSATGFATDPEGTRIESTDSITTELNPTSSFSFDKRAGAIDLGADDRPGAGDTITFTFVITNTGGTTLREPVIDDPRIGPVTCPAGDVAPKGTVTCEKVYTLTQDDIDSGAVNNLATASMTADPTAPAPADQSDSTSTPIAETNQLALTKTAGDVQTGADGRVDAGDLIRYTFVVTNNGNVTVDDIAVADPLLADATPAVPISCDVTTLLPGASATCFGDYPVTQDDIDAGAIANTATASGEDRRGNAVTSPVADEDVTLDRDDEIALDKAVNPGSPVDVNDNGVTDAGDTITYTFAITNLGNTTLDDVVVNDPKIGAITCPTGPLAPGDTVECTPKTYTVTSQDVLAGAVPNTATVTATGPDDNETEATDQTSTPTAARPIAVDDESTGRQGKPQSVDPLANDRAGDPTVPLVRGTLTLLDQDGNPATTVTVAAGSYEIVDGRIVFTPIPTFTGTPDPVDYRVADAKGTQVQASYQPQVTAITPTAEDDTSTGLQGRVQTIDVLANDDPGATDTPLDRTSLRLLDGGDPVTTLTVPDVGRYDVVDGRIVFTPLPTFTGDAPAVGYQIADINGTIATAELTVSVTAVTPTAEDDEATGPQGLPVTINVLANDAPGSALVQLDPASLRLLDGDTPVSTLTIPDIGRFDVVNGTIVFTPEPGFVGDVPTVDYRIADVNGTTADASIDVTITAVNPQAAADTSSDSQGRPQSVQPLANDAAGNDDVPLDPETLTLLDAEGDPATTVTVTGGTYTLVGTTITFTPDPGYTGSPDPVRYRVADENGTTTSSTYAPQVTPVTRPDTSGGVQGQPQSVNPLTNDDRDADVVLDPDTLALLDPATGQPSDSVTIVDQGTYRVNNGRIVFTPLPTFSGAATPITYLVDDQTGATLSDTYRPTVTPLNPGLNPDVASGPQGVPLTVDPLFNDTPGDPTAPINAATLTLLDANGQPTDTVEVDEGTYTLADGKITFTPNPDFVGSATPVRYRVADANGTTGTSTFTPTFTAVVPVLTDDTTDGPQGVPQSVDPLANDLPGDPAVPLDADSLTLLDADGDPTDTVEVEGGTYTLVDGRIVFTPEADFVGTAPSVTYRVADANGTSRTATYTPSFAEVTPTAVDDSSTGTQGAPQTVNPLANDRAGDPAVPLDPDSLTLLDADGNPTTSVTVTGGVYSLDGTTLTFTPDPGYTGDPTPVRYRVADENGTTTTASYAPSVRPVTRPDTSTGLQGADQSVDPLANDTLSDVDLDPASLALLDPATGEPAQSVTIANQGTYRVENGRIVFDPLPTFVGTATPVTYFVDDVDGNTMSDTYTPTVISVTPGLNDDSSTGRQGLPQSVDPLANDLPGDPTVDFDRATLTLLDADGDPADTVEVEGGTYTLVDGRIVFTPDADFVGDAPPVTYRVADTNGTTGTAQYRPTVTPFAPVANDDTSTGKQGLPQSVNPLANDRPGGDDVPLDADTLTLLDDNGDPVDSVEVEGGTYTIDDGRIVFTPDSDFVGTADPVRYRVEDTDGRQIEASYTPTVTAISPVAVNDTSEGRRGAPQSVNPLANDRPGDDDMPLDPTSLTLLDAAGLPTNRVVVTGGVYTLADGRITFTPDADFVGTAPPVRYQVADENGTLAVARYTPTVIDDTIVENIAKKADKGDTVVLDPVAATPGLLPGSVRLIDPVTGARVTRVVVPGEGIWSVDPATGKVTFEPSDDLVGDPTPVAYVGETEDGVPVEGTLSIDYVSGGTDPGDGDGDGDGDGSGNGDGNGTGPGTGLTPGSGSGVGDTGIKLLPATGAGRVLIPLGVLGLVLLVLGGVLVRRRGDESQA